MTAHSTNLATPPWLQVHIYDAVGNYISKMNLYCLDDAAAATQLVGIDWYDGAEGYSDPGQPTLALGMENGRLQLQRHETDENPVLIDTGMVRRMRAYARAYACGAGWPHPHRPPSPPTSACHHACHDARHVHVHVHDACMHIYMQVASSIKWNTNGSVLAVSGNQTSSGATSRDVSMVQFYSAHGQHLRTLKVR